MLRKVLSYVPMMLLVLCLLPATVPAQVGACNSTNSDTQDAACAKTGANGYVHRAVRRTNGQFKVHADSLATPNTFRVLHAFGNIPDGQTPLSPPIMDASGNLYTTTSGGGVNAVNGGLGAVYKVSANGAGSVLYSFAPNNDGQSPYGSLSIDSSGNLWGTTVAGSASCAVDTGDGGCDTAPGAVFKLSPDGSTETVMASFTGTNGSKPVGGLVQDSAGNFWGVTTYGGTYGQGTVFKMTPSGTLTVVHSFTSSGNDGNQPYTQALAVDASGNLYGTTQRGGWYGCGAAFKIASPATSPAFSVINNFQYSPCFALGGLTYSNGNLYGATEFGGDNGTGDVYKMSVSGQVTELYSFQQGSDGYNPVGRVAVDSSGNVYGTTTAGGSHGVGFIYKVPPAGLGDGSLTPLYSFNNSTDGFSANGVMIGSDGNLYGTNAQNGPGSFGTMWSWGLSAGSLTTATAVTSSHNPSVFGQAVSFAATVTASSGTPNGTVQFVIDGGNFGSPVTLISGTATSGNTSTLTVLGSPHAVTAVYSGATGYQPSQGTLSQVVNKASTTTGVISSLSPSTYGQAVSFTATVTASSGTPTGTVQFKIDGSNFGSPVTLASGSATSGSTTTLTVGTHTVTAVYSGDASFLTSTGTFSQVVNQATAGTIVTTSGSPSAYGQLVTFTATINGQYNLVKGRNGRAQPQAVTGSVTWSANTACGTTTVTTGNPGVATCATSILPVGTDTITATYSGDGNHNGSTGTLSGGQVVNQVSTTTTVVSSLNPSNYGQPVSFTANVSGSSPTGTVQFMIDGSAFGSPVTLASAAATSGSISTLAVGGHSITAIYSGDTNNAGSTSPTLTQTVNQVGATVTVASSQNPSVYGQAVTFTATISGQSGMIRGRNGRARPQIVTGTVTWSDNTGCGTTPVTSGDSGVATCTASILAVGTSDAITATYSGDSNNGGGTGTLGQEVDAAGSNVSIASSQNPSVYGQSVTFTATIDGANGMVKSRNGRAKSKDVSGLVNWSDNTGCGTTPVTAGYPGVATCTTTILAVGTDTVTANYGGDANHNAGSGSVSQVVNASNGNVSVASGLNPSTYGQSVTFTATVTGDNGMLKRRNGAKPMDVSGAVSWSANTGCPDSTVSGYPGVATCTTTIMAVGSDTVTANYGGDANHNAGSGSVNQVVNASNGNVSVASGLNPSTYGQSVTFTATVTGDSGAVKHRNGAKPMDVTGTVSWSANTGCADSTVFGYTGVATCTTLTLGAGKDTVTANYSGDANHNGGSGSVSQVVNQASQTINVTTGAPLTATNKSSFTVVANATSGLPVAFTSSGACTNSGTTYTMNGTLNKVCTVIMNVAGNANYTAASQVTETTTVVAAAKPTASLTGAPAKALYGSEFTVMAASNEIGSEASIPVITTTTPAACSVSGSASEGTSVTATVTMLTGVGTCSLKATWAANYVYAAATATAHTTAQKITPTVSFTGAPTSASNGTSFTVTATFERKRDVRGCPDDHDDATCVQHGRGEQQRTGQLPGHDHDVESEGDVYDQGSVGHEQWLCGRICLAAHYGAAVEEERCSGNGRSRLRPNGSSPGPDAAGSKRRTC